MPAQGHTPVATDPQLNHTDASTRPPIITDFRYTKGSDDAHQLTLLLGGDDTGGRPTIPDGHGQQTCDIGRITYDPANYDPAELVQAVRKLIHPQGWYTQLALVVSAAQAHVAADIRHQLAADASPRVQVEVLISDGPSPP